MMWLIACVALVAFAIVAELVARVAIRRGDAWFVNRPGSRLHMSVDTDAVPGLEPFVRTHINRDGERGSEPPKDADGLYRVLVCGGSSVEGFLLDQPSSWPEVIARELSTPERLRALGARRVHVGSVAKSLIGTEIIKQIFERIFPRYRRLDAIVIFCGCGNPVHWLMTRTPAVIADRPDAFEAAFDVRPDLPYGWSPKRLALVDLARRAAVRSGLLTEKRSRAGKKLIDARRMRQQATTVLDVTPDPEHMFKHFEDTLRGALKLARAKAKRVIVVLQPWLDPACITSEIDKMLWHGAGGQPYTQNVDTYYTTGLIDRLSREIDVRMARVAAEEGVEKFDLSPRIPRDYAHFYDLFHPTPAGAAAIGHAFAEYIAAGAPRSVPGQPVDVARKR